MKLTSTKLNMPSSSKFKRLFISIISLLTLLVVIKCNKEASPFLSVNTNSIQVPNTASTQKITISASGTWTAKADQTWVRLSISSGKGSSEISIEVDLNPNVTGRSSNIKLEANDVASSQIVIINQNAGEPYLKISRVQLTFGMPSSMAVFR